MAIDPITLTEGNLYDIGHMVCKVTKEVLQEAMSNQHIVLGAIRAQLQELQVQPPEEGTVATYNVTGTLAVE